MLSKKKILKFFGQNVKKNRKKKGVTIEELSLKTGIRKQYLEKIERGEAFGVRTSHLFIIADALDVPPHILTEGL